MDQNEVCSKLELEEGCRVAGEHGVSAVAIRNAGHTGRRGATG